MLLIIQILILFSLMVIAVQDFKERKIYLFLLLVLGGLIIFYRTQTSFLEVFLFVTLLNLSLVFTIVSILAIYVKFKMNTTLFDVFGLGDLLFFIVVSFAFPSLPFFVWFVFSLVFSLLIFLVIKNSITLKTVPLAGLQAIFFIIVFILEWFF